MKLIELTSVMVVSATVVRGVGIEACQRNGGGK